MTLDHVDGQVQQGGTASYAAAVAARLGVHTAILTRAADDFVPPPQLEGVHIYRQPAARTTVFEHDWHSGSRDQFVRVNAGPITALDVPSDLRAAAVVLFGSVANEIETSLLTAFARTGLRGAALQGWLRRIAPNGHVEAIDPESWQAAPVLSALDAAFLSDEDLGTDLPPARRRALLDHWAQQLHILAVTRGDQGAWIAVDGRWQSIAAVPAREVEATGAGDAFAAAFLIRYHETADVLEAGQFAACVASFVVEAHGLAGAPDRTAVGHRRRASVGNG